jgi:hypothetical protein
MPPSWRSNISAHPRDVPCEECGAHAAEPCRAQDGERRGNAMYGYHAARKKVVRP